MEDAILKLIDEARRQGEAAGLRKAVGVVQAYLAVLNNSEMSSHLKNVDDRRDQLERVLKTLLEQK